MTTVITEGRRTAEYLISEANGHRSREQVTVTGGNYEAGTVLGQITTGAATAALVAGGTGNGTFSVVVVGAAAVPGIYSLVATAATKFRLEDPAGVLVGVVTLGTEFVGGGLTFTFTAGATPHVVGDRATITVAAGSGKYAIHDPDAVNGTEAAAAILFDNVDASAADRRAVITARDSEVNGNVLEWKAGTTADQKTAAAAALAASGIIVRS